MKNIKKVYILMGIGVALMMFNYFVLPEQVVMQIAFDGTPNNYAPKIIALIFPFALSLFGCTLYLKSENADRKYLLIAAIGDITALLTYIFNR